MKIKKFICLSMCAIMLIGCSACKKNPTDSSSDYYSNISSTVSYSDVEFIESNSSSANDETGNSSQNPTSSTTSDSTDSSTKSEPTPSKDALEETFGFSSIKKVEYYCIKNIPQSDALYAVATIITNNGEDICDFTSEIICKDKNVTVNDKIITIPQSYLKSKDSILLTARHVASGISYDFTLKFEKPWNVIFEDNFDGTELNTDVWEVWDEMRDNKYSYSKDAMFLDGKGNLINRVSVLKDYDPAVQDSRQSGAITTKDKYETTYGYFEIRMKPHLTTGMWSAFWLMAGDMGDVDAVEDNSAVNGCEIDVVETIFSQKLPSHAIHWDGYYNDQTETFSASTLIKPNPEVFDGNFHTFAVRWSGYEYVFLVDGKVTVTAYPDHMGICKEPAYLLISSHIGEWAGNVTLQPGEYSDTVVDYVRVYQSSNDPK